MIKQKLTFIISLTLFSLCVCAQEAVNLFDEEGKRHGPWTKNFEKTKQVRYSGQFSHGKEVGEFRYYQLVGKVSKLAAVKTFDDNSDQADVKYFSLQGNVISEGKMKGKRHIGKWLYYHKNSEQLMTEENFNDQGQLHGQRLVYYVNGQVAEKMNYINGNREGEALYYAMNGVVIKEYVYKNDMLHGPSKHFDESGQIQIEGNYKNGKKHGVWTYYRNGEIFEEKDFSFKSRNKG
ncbi:MAG: toxin-antitoxin system YwqK family antitoxin [Bacteroidia bacterium]|nr:toxin-antitoxin system YwqK family antitoxin [Bacteroidia bacterium]NNL81587.1 toxin-antitoxin system YwqK family antitoxin [Flavobacteriaceae bacterium]